MLQLKLFHKGKDIKFIPFVTKDDYYREIMRQSGNGYSQIIISSEMANEMLLRLVLAGDYSLTQIGFRNGDPGVDEGILARAYTGDRDAVLDISNQIREATKTTSLFVHHILLMEKESHRGLGFYINGVVSAHEDIVEKGMSDLTSILTSFF